MKAHVSIPAEKLAAFCRQHHVRRLALFGSVLRDDFRPDSDVDVLVEFESEHIPGFLGLAGLEEELGRLIGRKVDLNTPGCFKPQVRARLADEALVQFG